VFDHVKESKERVKIREREERLEERRMAAEAAPKPPPKP
jgi:hypothetical protein